MGSGKNKMHEDAESKRDKILAQILGITVDELDQTQWSLNEETSKDGLVYHLLVEFDEDNSPQEILDKIEGLENNNTVWLEPNALDITDLEP